MQIHPIINHYIIIVISQETHALPEVYRDILNQSHYTDTGRTTLNCER